MIPGIVAVNGYQSAPPPFYSPLYDGALVVMDFENNVYKVNSTDVALSSLISNTSYLQTGGFRIDWGVAPYGPPIDFLSAGHSVIDLAVGYTIYLEFVQYSATSSQYYFDFWNGLNGDFRCEIEVFQYGATELNSYDWRKQLGVPYTQRFVDLYGYTAANGVLRKIACTTQPNRLALAEHGVSGASTLTATRPASYSVWKLFGRRDETNFACNVLCKRIIFYPPKVDADIQALTVL